MRQQLPRVKWTKSKSKLTKSTPNPVVQRGSSSSLRGRPYPITCDWIDKRREQSSGTDGLGLLDPLRGLINIPPVTSSPRLINCRGRTIVQLLRYLPDCPLLRPLIELMVTAVCGTGGSLLMEGVALFSIQLV